MDIPSERARRKNRSTTNLSHLTLAPLTSKLPIDDTDTIFPNTLLTSQQSISYLQGKSAPTTPRLLSHSPAASRSRSHHRRTPSAPGTQLPKSKSSSHLAHGGHGSRKSITGTMTPGRRKETTLGPDDRNDSDWLLRTAAMMSTEARESKGQAWLVSRQSSTSLGVMRDPDEEAFEEELQLERDLASRRGSSAMADDDFVTPGGSRYQSRSQSRNGTRSRLLTPLERGDEHGDSYFPRHDAGNHASGPDFVNLDERLEALDTAAEQDDEDAVRRLVRRGQHGTGSWLWSFLSVEENDQDRSDDEGSVDSFTGSRGSTAAEGQGTGRSGWSGRHFEGVSNVPEERMPPPKADEGGWQDAAWLLSVASKVLF
ncbi:hypothetical protein NLU13_5151 [Sarocladium strictum]|uniref:Uncharacterized protein n=1 Tax=Sarocladium strictum TaxID=5046 RepID=A0AA39L7C5_SARSR|nr:hypothetical protein NLU13_5151 [Sarocladium strictum]